RRGGYEVGGRDPAGVAWVRELGSAQTDREIAALLNQEGFRSGTRCAFTAAKIQWIRYAHSIPSGCPDGPAACPDGYRGDGRCSARVAAVLLNVKISTITAWCRSGRLDSVQAVPHGPRWIRLTPEVIAEFGQPTRRHWSR